MEETGESDHKSKFPPGMNTDRLNSWKEIARYLNRDISTCIKWEKDYRLPVYRLDPNSPRPTVFAFKRELDEWFEKKAHGNRDR